MITIIKDNSIAVVPAFPKDYICQYCSSVIRLSVAGDIKNNIQARLVDAESLKTNKTVNALGFNCPVCHNDNITG